MSRFPSWARARPTPLAQWFATLPPGQQPNVVLYSPYLRARATAQAILQCLGPEDMLAVVSDERLREKEFGITDRLTPLGYRG